MSFDLQDDLIPTKFQQGNVIHGGCEVLMCKNLTDSYLLSGKIISKLINKFYQFGDSLSWTPPNARLITFLHAI